jgi:hypothetical protein
MLDRKVITKQCMVQRAKVEDCLNDHQRDTVRPACLNLKQGLLVLLFHSSFDIFLIIHACFSEAAIRCCDTDGSLSWLGVDAFLRQVEAIR